MIGRIKAVSLFQQPAGDDASYLKLLRDASQGELKPAAGETVRSGVYDNLVIPEDVNDVTIARSAVVVILGRVTVNGRGIEGTIYMPVGTSEPALGRNPLRMNRKTPFVLASMSGLTDE